MWNHSEGHSGKNGPGGEIHRPYPGLNVAPSLLAKSAQLYNYVVKAENQDGDSNLHIARPHL